MWDIEVNIAGYRFIHQVPERRTGCVRRPVLRAHRTWSPSVVRDHVRHLLAA